MFDDIHADFHKMIHHAMELLAQYFQVPLHFSKIIQLSEPGRRNNILRLQINNPTRNMPSSLILKNTSIENIVLKKRVTETEEEQLNRFTHDWAGLEFLTQIGSFHAPRFYCGSIEHKFIIIEDLGDKHSSLVDPLTRKSSPEHREDAEKALSMYVKRLGQMHADTAGKFSKFKSILERINPRAFHYNTIPKEDSIKIFEELSLLTGDHSKELIQEIEFISQYSQSANQFHVLLHGDICPDNVFYQDGNICLIDFEFADFGNALIDATYLRMCMPSCWCSKSVPIEIRNKMEKIYRNELQKSIKSINDNAIYNEQLAFACGYWLLKAISQIEKIGLLENEWICPSGPVEADSQWDPKTNAFRPRIISRIGAFIECAKATGHFPKLLQASQKLLIFLQKQWPDIKEIELFPVFRI